jgi:hypothetical protein
MRLLHDERIGLDIIEAGLRAAVLKDASSMLGLLLNEAQIQGGGEAERPGEKRYRRRPKVMETLFGPITICRDYFCQPGAGEGRAPFDERLGLIEGYSPGLAKMMGRAGARHSYQSGAEDLCHYAGVDIEARALARMVNLLGPQMETARQSRDLPHEPASVPVLYVEADGTGVPMTRRELAGRKGKAEDGSAKIREIKVGCVFTQHSSDAEGNPLRDPFSTTYVANFQPAEDFGLRLRQEAFRRGMSAAEEIVFLGDGAPWVWELARVNFPQATCILDFYHAAEHLTSLADSLYGEGSEMAARKTRQWIAMLKEDGVDLMIGHVRDALPSDTSRREDIQKQLAYFEKNRARMFYGTFRSSGFFIGSGIVEAGCKTVVGQRLKNSGMFWSLHGAQNVLTLRTALLGNHFDADWERRSARAA